MAEPVPPEKKILMAFAASSDNWKPRPPQPSADLNTLDQRRLSRNDFDIDVPASLRDIHEHVAELERALCEEADGRISAEERIREQVDAKVKVAIERLADATETEMARMYRRIEADVMNRLDGISREMSSLSSSVTKLNRQMEIVTVEARENRDLITKLGKRLDGLGEGTAGPAQVSPILDAGKKEISRLKEMVENDLNNSKKIMELDDLVNSKMATRIEMIEDWLKGNLTPEVLRLKEMIQAESLQREDHDKEIMGIVSQYTNVMRRHFDTITESTYEATIKPPREQSTEEPKPDQSGISSYLPFGIGGKKGKKKGPKPPTPVEVSPRQEYSDDNPDTAACRMADPLYGHGMLDDDSFMSESFLSSKVKPRKLIDVLETFLHLEDCHADPLCGPATFLECIDGRFVSTNCQVLGASNRPSKSNIAIHGKERCVSRLRLEFCWEPVGTRDSRLDACKRRLLEKIRDEEFWKHVHQLGKDMLRHGSSEVQNMAAGIICIKKRFASDGRATNERILDALIRPKVTEWAAMDTDDSPSVSRVADEMLHLPLINGIVHRRHDSVGSHAKVVRFYSDFVDHYHAHFADVSLFSLASISATYAAVTASDGNLMNGVFAKWSEWIVLRFISTFSILDPEAVFDKNGWTGEGLMARNLRHVELRLATWLRHIWNRSIRDSPAVDKQSLAEMARMLNDFHRSIRVGVLPGHSAQAPCFVIDNGHC